MHNLYRDIIKSLRLFKIVIVVVLLALAKTVLAQTPSGKLTIGHLSGDVYLFSTYKSYKGQTVSAHGLYVLSKEGAVMIDTPWDTTQLQPLLDTIEARHHMNVTLCIARIRMTTVQEGFPICERKA